MRWSLMMIPTLMLIWMTTAEKDEISLDDFILVEFLGKRVKKYFAGEVKEDTSEGHVVTFLWRKSPKYQFVFPEVVDE